jgi:hypothetical protein
MLREPSIAAQFRGAGEIWWKVKGSGQCYRLTFVNAGTEAALGAFPSISGKASA